MKQTSMTLLATAAFLSLSSLVGADEVATVPTENIPIPTNRVYAGPEFFWSHFRGELDSKHDVIDYELKNNSYYGGIRLGYEYLKPDAFYANTDILLALGEDHGKLSKEKGPKRKEKKLWEKTKDVFRGNHAHFWSQYEQRFGYTWSSTILPTCTLTWYGAPGFHLEHERSKNAYWWYAATGLKTLQQFCKNFFMGLDFKVMYNFAAHDEHQLIKPTTLGRKQFWGYQVDVPFKWTVGDSQAFDVEVKPYLLKLNTLSPETILGIRVELGYNF